MLRKDSKLRVERGSPQQTGSRERRGRSEKREKPYPIKIPSVTHVKIQEPTGLLII
jgi:hypothetical protein